MKVAQWAEIRRLSEIESLSQRATARRLRCSHRTVKKALALTQPPDENRRAARGSILDPFKSKIDALLANIDKLRVMNFDYDTYIQKVRVRHGRADQRRGMRELG